MTEETKLIARLRKLEEEANQSQQVSQTPPNQPKPRKTTILGNFEISRPKTFRALLLWVALGIAIGWLLNEIVRYVMVSFFLFFLSLGALAYAFPLFIAGFLVWLFVFRK
jgi:hypothetical protein